MGEITFEMLSPLFIFFAENSRRESLKIIFKAFDYRVTRILI